jgi:hypothetical protein
MHFVNFKIFMLMAVMTVALWIISITKPIPEPTHFNPGDKGSLLLRNVGIHPKHYIVLQPRSQSYMFAYRTSM